MKKSSLNILLLCLLLFSNVFAQEGNRGLDRKKWKDIKEGVRYESKKPAANEKNREWKPPETRGKSGTNEGSYSEGKRSNNWNKRSAPSEYRPKQKDPPKEPSESSELGAFFMILLVAILLGVVVFLIYKNYKRNPIVKGTPVTVDLETAPQEIPISELKKLLNSALENENYREAIRIYFIFIIRELTNRNWIVWMKDKTNIAYLREMRKQQFFEDFKITVQIFEVVWYGKESINRTTFEQLEPFFKRLHEKLNIK